MIYRVLFLFALLTVAVHASESAEAELFRLRNAMDAATTQMDMNIASGELAQYWERMLLAEEKQVLAACDEEAAALFRKTQDAWREYRRMETEFQSDAYRGGSIQPLIINLTYASLTETRILALKAYLEPK